MRHDHDPAAVMPLTLPPPFARRALRALAITSLLVAAAVAQAANWRVVFPLGVAGQAAFVDGDCYARMTRARLVLERPGRPVRAHDFENFPVGVRPHTTAPLDYGLAGLAGGLRWLRPADGAALALDRAGTLVSPLLGAATLGFLAWWSGGRGEPRGPGRWPALTLAATSPVLAHAFALGRPDHQSLQLLCVAVALAAETVLWRRSSRPWALAGGLAWSLALWVSLYEPLALLVGTFAATGVFARETLRARERGWQLAALAGLLGTALLVEGGGRLELPGRGAGTDAGQLAAWGRQIGELGSTAPWSGLILRWVGVGIFAAPVLLWLAWRQRGDRGAALWLVLLSATWALTCWQLRWGYFLALVTAMSLPAQAHALTSRRRWVLPLAGAAWLAGMVPTFSEFATRADRAWRPHPEDRQRAAEAVALMGTADFLRADADADADLTAPAGGILAPWWLSPALAYRSGQPAVAGSSHESLPGTADAARFFLCPARDPAAFTLLHARRVRWVVTDDADRTLPTAADLLGTVSSFPADETLGAVLARFPRRAPRGLRLVRDDPFFKVYAVDALVYGPDP